jgi:hypothetical protein
MRFRPDFKKSRPPEIFGSILNLPIVAFQTGLIEFLSKAARKSRARSFGFVGCRRYSNHASSADLFVTGIKSLCFQIPNLTFKTDISLGVILPFSLYPDTKQCITTRPADNKTGRLLTL